MVDANAPRPMKTAVIISGAMRTFDKCLPNLQWQVFRHFPSAKFYILTEDDEDAHKTDLFKGAVVRKVKQPPMEIPPGCPDTWTQGQPYMHEPYAISVHPHAVLGQLWMLREGWRLYQEANDPADLVIRCRPDLWFHSFEVPAMVSDLMKDAPGSAGFRFAALTPWWGNFGSGANDRFALLGKHAAEQYFTTYDRIGESIAGGAPLHPETLVGLSVQQYGCFHFRTLKAEFSTLRKTGEMRPPEITMVDLAHAGMR